MKVALCIASTENGVVSCRDLLITASVFMYTYTSTEDINVLLSTKYSVVLHYRDLIHAIKGR